MTLKYFNVKNGLTTGNITLNASNGNIVGSKFSGNIAVTASANLGAVGNLVITGGSNGQVLTTSGNGSVSWTTVEPLSAPTVVLNSFSGTGEQSQFVLSTTPESINFTLVNIDGVSQIHDAYTVVGSTVTFDDPPNSGSVIEVMIFIGGSAGGGGSANVAGSNTQVQYNDNGSLGASAGLTFDGSTTTLTVNNFIATSTANLGAVGNITVTGGTVGQVLSSNGSGGLAWANIGGSASGTYATRAYTGNGVQTTFTITSGMTADSVIVTENGIVQKPVTDYTVSGATLVFIEAPLNNVAVQIRELAYGGGSSASVAGSNTQLQFNNAGNLGASAGLTFNSSTTTLAANNLVTTSTANLGAVGNITITGGSANYVLSTNGAGNLTWVPQSSGGISSAAAVGYSLIFGG